MSEPDSYPHTYKAELKFKYKNGAGETEMLVKRLFCRSGISTITPHMASKPRRCTM